MTRGFIKMPYTQIYDETKECWVLKKVDALPINLIERRRWNHDDNPPPGTRCLNCNQPPDPSHRWHGGFVMCRGNANYFEW